MVYLLAVPSRGGARLGDSHAETVDAAVLIVHVQEESVWFTLIAPLSSHQILTPFFVCLVFWRGNSKFKNSFD